jgi:hypothetical protein
MAKTTFTFTYKNPWHIKGAKGYHAIRGGPATYTCVKLPRRHFGHFICEPVTKGKNRWHVVFLDQLKGCRKTLKAAKELAKRCQIERLTIRMEDFAAIVGRRQAVGMAVPRAKASIAKMKATIARLEN